MLALVLVSAKDSDGDRGAGWAAAKGQPARERFAVPSRGLPAFVLDTKLGQRAKGEDERPALFTDGG